MHFSRIHTCLNCFTKNRITVRHLADHGHCGVCKTRFAPLSHPLDVNSAAMEDIIRHAKVPVLVAFRASWCGKSRNAGTELRDLAHELAGYGLVLRVDIDENPDVITNYHVQSTPSYMLFRDGQPVLQRRGVLPRHDILRWTEPSPARAGSATDSLWGRLVLG